MLVYSTLLGITCSLIALVDPALRAEWAPHVIAVLFPIGETAFFLSQLIGGFLTAAVGLALGNLGAAIPLFVSGAVMGFVHGGLLVILIQCIRWAIRLARGKPSSAG
jgi:hypothetical protein